MFYAAAYLLYLGAPRSVPAPVAGMLCNFIPVFGVATAYLFLGERLSPIQWTGAATIRLSMLALLIGNARAEVLEGRPLRGAP